MQSKFKNWLLETDKTESTAYNYAQAINRISKHLQSSEAKLLNLYKITTLSELEPYVQMYDKGGKYEEEGNKGNGTNRASIKAYKDFISNPENLQEEIIQTNEIVVFEAEKQLQSAIVYDLSNLFPDYKLFDEQYEIEGKKIDILLKKGNDEFLILELKNGKADFKAFGQISMYIGLLQGKFPNSEIKGCIIANDIDFSLEVACRTNSNVSLKVYNLKVELVNY